MLAAERSPEDMNAMCSFCGENKASALWMGHIEIFSCGHCASELLPQFMADAIVGDLNFDHVRSSSGPTNALSKQSRILERFNGAFSSALLRKVRLSKNTE